MVRPVALSVAWLVGCAILAGLALRHASGDELRLARYIGYVMPWLLVGVVPGALWAWRMRALALSGTLALCAGMIVLPHLRMLERREGSPGDPALTLSVMSFNTWSKNGDEREIARVIRERVPDLLLLQEIPPDVLERVRGNLAGLYGGAAVHWAYEPEIQQGIASRYPVGASAALKNKGQAQKAVLRTPAGPVTVLNVHPLRFGGWRSRHDQMAALLAQDVLPERTPVILAGDLNAPEHSQVYGLLEAHLGEAHRTAGTGFGFTYPAAGLRLLGRVPAFPVVRIDHVFFSRHFVALRAETLRDSGGSDHRPVVAVLALTPDAWPAREALAPAATRSPAPRARPRTERRARTVPAAPGRSRRLGTSPRAGGAAG